MPRLATDDPVLSAQMRRLISRLRAIQPDALATPIWLRAMDREIEISVAHHRDGTYINLFARNWFAIYIERRPWDGTTDEMEIQGNRVDFHRDCVAFALGGD